MKKFSLILLCCFWFSVCSADVNVVVGQPAVVAGVTPVYHNEMSSVTNPHTPTIGNSTVVYNSPSISGDGVDFDTNGKCFYSTQTWGGNTGTIVISLRPHETGDPAAVRTYAYESAGNLLIRMNETSSGNIQAKYGASSCVYYTLTDFVQDQLVTIRFTWEINDTKFDTKLYINENSTPVATASQIQSVIAPTVIRIGDYTSAGGFTANAVIEDIKIYDQVVTP